MIINGIKTKVMKFRKGGKLARYHHFICGKHRLEALRGSNTCDMQNIIHMTHLGQICSSNSSDPQHSKSILAINWHSNSTFQPKNLSRSNLWGTADLERPHGTEREEAGKHKSHVPKIILCISNYVPTRIPYSIACTTFLLKTHNLPVSTRYKRGVKRLSLSQ
jgi:hypothetical protein